MTGKPQLKLVAPEGLNNLTPEQEQALARCRWRSVCAPCPPEDGAEVAIEGCVVLTGAPGRLRQDVVERLWMNVRGARTFMICCEREDTMRHVLGMVDKMGSLAALEAATPAGHA